MIYSGKHKFNFFRGQIDNNFIAFISAFIVFLSILFTGIILNLNGIFSKWENGISNNIIVQILPNIDVDNDNMDKRLSTAESILSKIKGIRKISIISQDKVKKEMVELLGSDTKELLESIPLPYIIEIKTSKFLSVNSNDIKKALNKSLKNFTVFSHSKWANNFYGFAKIVKNTSFFILLILITTSILTIFYFTKSFLKVQRKVIRVIHIVGANNESIANTFSNRILILSSVGAIIGIILATISSLISSQFITGIKEILMISYSHTLVDWLILLLIPIIIVFSFYKTAQITVLSYLNKRD